MTIRSMHLGNSPSCLRLTPVKPAFLYLSFRVDLDGGQISMSEYRQPFLTALQEQAVRSVDVGTDDQSVISAPLQDLLDT